MKRTSINIISNVLVTITNIVIGFWLSPYIIAHVGVEANGFISLAQNFIVYASLAVTALNSMAARFITIEYVKKNYDRANLYYNSVFWGNLIIVAVLLPCSILIIRYLEIIINIPTDLVLDVKLMFSFVFLNFFLETGAPNWDCGTFVSNRLERKSIPAAVLSVIRAAFIISIMSILVPHIWYVGLASTLVSVGGLLVGMYNTHQLTPELRIRFGKKKKICSWKAIKELVGSGIWNTVSNLGSMLLNGLDLLLCNLFIGPTEMGILALGRVLPSYLLNFANTIFNAFAPEIIINYAEGDKEKQVHGLIRAMKILSFLLSIPLCGMIVLSKDFFSLWVPSQDSTTLSIIAILICSEYAFTSGTLILNSVFLTVNKVKVNSLLIVTSGAVSTLIVFVLLNTTNLGIYAIAGISVVINLLRMNLYTIPYSAKYLDVNCKPFFLHEIKCVLDTILICAICFGLLSFIHVNSWPLFIVKGLIVTLVCFFTNYYLFLNKEERKIILKKIKIKR